MKKTSTKIISAIIIILIAVVGIWAAQKYLFGPKVHGDKAVTITIENEVDNKTLVKDKVYYTNATTLEQFLQENQKELNVEMDSTSYGPFLMGLDGLKTTDMKTGPWWMYAFTSKNPDVDYKVGAAPGVDKVNLGKESNVTFVFTNKY